MAKRGYIVMENGEKMELEFFPNEAPNTVANFEKLANEGFYDELLFIRVIPGFVTQGGMPLGTGTGDPGYKIKCETVGNPHKHKQEACPWHMQVRIQVKSIFYRP